MLVELTGQMGAMYGSQIIHVETSKQTHLPTHLIETATAMLFQLDSNCTKRNRLKNNQGSISASGEGIGFQVQLERLITPNQVKKI